MTTLRRRWFRLAFSLRTLFVAVAVCELSVPFIAKAFAAYQRWQSERFWAKVGGPGILIRGGPHCEFEAGEDSPATQAERP